MRIDRAVVGFRTRPEGCPACGWDHSVEKFPVTEGGYRWRWRCVNCGAEFHPDGCLIGDEDIDCICGLDAPFTLSEAP